MFSKTVLSPLCFCDIVDAKWQQRTRKLKAFVDAPDIVHGAVAKSITTILPVREFSCFFFFTFPNGNGRIVIKHQRGLGREP